MVSFTAAKVQGYKTTTKHALHESLHEHCHLYSLRVQYMTMSAAMIHLSFEI